MNQTIRKDLLMRPDVRKISVALAGLCAALAPAAASASVESSLSELQNKLTHVILPVLSVIGIAWAAFSLMTGNERAKQHLLYAIVGSAIGFGAQAIVDFISQSVR